LKPKRQFSKKKILASVVVASALVVTGYKVNELSADPTGEKDCGPTNTGEGIPGVQAGFPKSPTVILAASGKTYSKAAMLALASTPPNWKQQGGTINDASCLDRTAVYGIVQVTNNDDIKNALIYARDNKLKVSMAGARHSMGGQAFSQNGVVLDMTKFNQMSLDEANKILTVQSGATWHDIQTFLHPKYAVKAMQSTDIFTVGGSISVNAHGMDHKAGSVGGTIKAMRVMLADGSIVTVSPTENPELFNLVVGGYGLFGVVLDVDIEITDNTIYQTERQLITYKDFPAVFDKEILPDDKLGLFYGHLSTAKESLLDELILYKYEQADVGDAEIPPLGEVSATRLRRLVLNFSKLGDIPMSIKWWAEKNVEPKIEGCTVVPRNQAMSQGEACFVSRNEPMHDSVPYARNDLKHETDILHEYFIPRDQFIPFVDGLRKIVQDNHVNLLNASVRIIHPEKNYLSYAPEEMYSIVLYINQPTTAGGTAQMGEVTRQMIDLVIASKGRFFLPYQLHYTPAQLESAYPEIASFFAKKADYDPAGLFSNTFYEKYSKLVATP
jgi:FAD/FMN-containing dehydrogenase